MKRGQEPLGIARLEIFSDAVIAVIITIIVLEIDVPSGYDLTDIKPLLPVFVAYALSFRTIGVYWSNHHKLLRGVKQLNGKIVWANLHLLFWLSLIPPATIWIGENYTRPWPTAFYGMVLLMASFAYRLLRITVVEGNSKAAREISEAETIKAWLTFIIYVLAIALAFVSHWISDSLYIFVALMWFIPDSTLKKIKNILVAKADVR